MGNLISQPEELSGDFPDEVLECIVRHVDCEKERLKLRLVNKRLKRLTDVALHQESLSPKWTPFSTDLDVKQPEKGVTFRTCRDIQDFLNDIKSSPQVERNPVATRKIQLWHSNDPLSSYNWFYYEEIPKLLTSFSSTITQCRMHGMPAEVARHLCLMVFNHLTQLRCLGLESIQEPDPDHEVKQRWFGRVPNFEYLVIPMPWSWNKDYSLVKDIMASYGSQLKSLECCLYVLDQYLTENHDVLFSKLEELKMESWGRIGWKVDKLFSTEWKWNLKRLSIKLWRQDRIQLDKVLGFISKFNATLEHLSLDINPLVYEDRLVELQEFPRLSKLAISNCLKDIDGFWRGVRTKCRALQQLTFLCRRNRQEEEESDGEDGYGEEEPTNDLESVEDGMDKLWGELPSIQRVRVFQHVEGDSTAYEFVKQVDRLDISFW